MDDMQLVSLSRGRQVCFNPFLLCWCITCIQLLLRLPALGEVLLSIPSAFLGEECMDLYEPAMQIVCRLAIIAQTWASNPICWTRVDDFTVLLGCFNPDFLDEGKQHCVFEALGILLGAFEVVLPVLGHQDIVFSDMFHTVYSRMTICEKGHSNFINERNSILHLAIHNGFSSLEQLLRAYFCLDSTDHRCTHCQAGKVTAIRIARPAVYWSINFNRCHKFIRTGTDKDGKAMGYNTKCTAAITYPAKLDIANFCTQHAAQTCATVYRLYAVVLHDGPADCGHYRIVQRCSETHFFVRDDSKEPVLIHEAMALLYATQSAGLIYELIPDSGPEVTLSRLPLFTADSGPSAGQRLLKSCVHPLTRCDGNIDLRLLTRELMFDLESTLGSVMPACLRDQDADPLTQLLYTLRRCTPDASFLDRRQKLGKMPVLESLGGNVTAHRRQWTIGAHYDSMDVEAMLMKVDQPLLGIVEDDQHVDVLPATAATAARKPMVDNLSQSPDSTNTSVAVPALSPSWTMPLSPSKQFSFKQDVMGLSSAPPVSPNADANLLTMVTGAEHLHALEARQPAGMQRVAEQAVTSAREDTVYDAVLDAHAHVTACVDPGSSVPIGAEAIKQWVPGAQATGETEVSNLSSSSVAPMLRLPDDDELKPRSSAAGSDDVAYQENPANRPKAKELSVGKPSASKPEQKHEPAVRQGKLDKAAGWAYYWAGAACGITQGLSQL